MIATTGPGDSLAGAGTTPAGPGGPFVPAQPPGTDLAFGSGNEGVAATARSSRRRRVGWLVPAGALAVGLAAGFLLTPRAPGWAAPYLPVGVVAALDAVAGGLRAALDRVFDDRVFVASFLTNGVVAVALVAFGVRLGVGGALTTAVLIVFGTRIFRNVTALRRRLLGV